MEINCATAWLKSEVCSLDLFVTYANSENKTYALSNRFWSCDIDYDTKHAISLGLVSHVE